MSTFGPYSPIVQAGSFYFVSGQVGVDPASKKAGRTAEEQTSQALANLASVLESEELDMQNVVKTTVYLTDMNDFAAVNKIYAGYFGANRPARAAIGVKELPNVGGKTPIKVEIEATAYREKE